MYITTKNGRRFPNPKFSAVKERIATELTKKTLEPAWYELQISVFMPIYTKAGKNPGRVKRIDSSNRIKLLEDELSKIVKLDDTFFKKVSIQKVNSDKESTEVKIFFISDLPDKWKPLVDLLFSQMA